MFNYNLKVDRSISISSLKALQSLRIETTTRTTESIQQLQLNQTSHLTHTCMYLIKTTRKLQFIFPHLLTTVYPLIIIIMYFQDLSETK